MASPRSKESSSKNGIRTDPLKQTQLQNWLERDPAQEGVVGGNDLIKTREERKGEMDRQIDIFLEHILEGNERTTDTSYWATNGSLINILEVHESAAGAVVGRGVGLLSYLMGVE